MREGGAIGVGAPRTARKLEPGFGTGRGERIESHCSRPSKSDAASARVRP